GRTGLNTADRNLHCSRSTKQLYRLCPGANCGRRKLRQDLPYLIVRGETIEKAQPGGRGSILRDRGRSQSNIVQLIGAENKHPILNDGTADHSTRPVTIHATWFGAAVRAWIFFVGLLLQVVHCIKVAIVVELPTCSVPCICSGARDQVELSTG